MITFESSGLDELISSMKKFSKSVPMNTVRAVNKTIASARADAASEIMDQVNFSRAYLGSANDRNSRLAITKRATLNDVEAVISARRRPTSLANASFLKSKKPGDIRVQVKPRGVSVHLRGAFVVRLRSGQTMDEDTFNLGLAIRTHANNPLRNSRAAKQIGPNLYLLYGPSVDQVFQTVRKDIEPKAVADLRNELIRLQRVF